MTSHVTVCQELKDVITIIDKIKENAYDYLFFEKLIKLVIEIIRKWRSNSLIFRTFEFAGLCCQFYCNFNMSIFYFMRALKLLYDQKKFYYFERIHEIEIYKVVARVLTKKNLYKEARQFAYKALRKSWVI